MPTYVYQCPQCDHEFEIFAKMSDRRRSRKCPTCGARATRKITGGAGFLFKGEGFYITDYRSEEYRSKEKAEKEKPAQPSSAESPAKSTSDAGSAGAEKPARSDAGNGPRPTGGKKRPRGRRPSSEG